MIPGVEKDRLQLAIVTATECAKEGRLADGYSCLIQGRMQARRAMAQDEPWAAELYLRYIQAEDDYIARYGVRIG
jgi:hypothetical protein